MVFDISAITIPTQPGCYLYKDSQGKLLYIGKAKNIRKRVLSYFTKKHEDVKTRQLVSQIGGIDFFVTKTEVEALLLESTLIKKHKPKYNIELKDSRRYGYIVVTAEKYPRIFVGRHKKIPGEYFGPFTDARLRNTLIRMLRKVFFIRTCRTLPKRACLRYHIGLCKAPCIDAQTHADYVESVERAKAILRGKTKDVLKRLKQEMLTFSASQQFEQAQVRRDQIEALKMLEQRQLIESQSELSEDAVNYAVIDGKMHIVVFNVRNGVLQHKEEFSFDVVRETFEEFLKRFYEPQGAQMPKRILLPRALEDTSIQKYLERVAGHAVKFVVPKKGSRKHLLELARKNIEVSYEEKDLVNQEFLEKLGIEGGVSTIECFDISHLYGDHMVGAMVRFVDGKPQKKNYRKFKIRTVEGIDDFRSIQEVVRRRYSRLLQESDSEKFVGFPDLIVIDGGREQLRFAKQALHELRLDIPIVGLAKKLEEIYFPGRTFPARFDKKSRMMRILMFARDEAHRFGLAYHRLLRSKARKK